MIKKILKKIQIKIKIWNPKYFINPFYSPSLACIKEMEKSMDELRRAILENILPDELRKETLENILPKQND